MSVNYDWVQTWEGKPPKNKKPHVETKKENYEMVRDYLDTPPKKILEIGCGLARESEWFQQEFGSELWLLDGDKEDNQDKQDRYYHWQTEAKLFAFYSPIDDLKKSYDSRGMKYRFVDANNIDIPENETFDLICSFKSCGFHYPLAEYVELIKKHSDENTRLIFDIRKEGDKLKETEYEIAERIFEGRKHSLCEIKLF